MNSVGVCESFGAAVRFASRGLSLAVLARANGDPTFARRVELAFVAERVVVARDEAAEVLLDGFALRELRPERAVVVAERTEAAERELVLLVIAHDPPQA